MSTPQPIPPLPLGSLTTHELEPEQIDAAITSSETLESGPLQWNAYIQSLAKMASPIG